MKKLDKGKYLERISKIESSSEEFSNYENNKENNITRKYESESDSYSIHSSSTDSKSDDPILNNIFNKLDDEKVSIYELPIKMPVEEINMDDDLTPVIDFYDEYGFYETAEINGGSNVILGNRELKRKINLKKYNNIFSRKLKRRINI